MRVRAGGRRRARARTRPGFGSGLGVELRVGVRVRVRVEPVQQTMSTMPMSSVVDPLSWSGSASSLSLKMAAPEVMATAMPYLVRGKYAVGRWVGVGDGHVVPS